jgi:hypothetical protein
MNVKRTTIIVVAGGALAAWLAAAATSRGPDIGEPLILKSPAIDASGALLASEIARLHERLRPTAMPPQAGRDLFSFVASRPRPVELVKMPAAALTEAPIRRPTLPAMRLSGIAEDATPDGVVRTAIISGFGQLFLAKEGDPVTDRYRVVRISSDVVELTDLADSTTLRLALR